MNIFLYDTEKYTLETVQETINYINEEIKSDCIFLPKDFNVLLDYSTEQLYSVRECIDNAIREKDIINNM